MPKRKIKYGSASDLSELLSLTQRRINQLVDTEIIRKEADGTFDLKEAIEQYYRFKFSTNENIDFQKEKALHERAKREIAEMTRDKMKGKLHSSEDVEIVMTDMLSTIKANFRAMPIKLTPLLFNKEKLEIQQILNEEVEHCLENLSEYNPKLFDIERVDSSEEKND